MNNKISPSGIEWCTHVWNPYWGCRNNCTYCYARTLAKRFAGQIAKWETEANNWLPKDEKKLKERLLKFLPTSLKFNFEKEFPQKTAHIFVGSMSDIEHWDHKDLDMTIQKCKDHPQHTFLFLTKNPKVYNDHIWPHNCWLGWTITRQADYTKRTQNGDIFPYMLTNRSFLSIEPLHGPVKCESLMPFDWVIVGAETGRKNRKIPKFDWLNSIYDNCGKLGIPIFMKPNLQQCFPDLQLKQDIPFGGKV